jgi:hypothetical protein
VTTTIAFPSLLLGGADKGGREEPRRDFRDVARWAPVVTTGDDGHARVGLRYPDNLTTWRITSRGATDATLVGKAVAKTLVTKDIVARLAGPRFFIAGDEAALVSIVNNRTDKPIADGEASVAVKGASLTGAASTKFSAPARGEARSEWRVKLPAEPDRIVSPAVLTFRARTKTDSMRSRSSCPCVRAPSPCARAAVAWRRRESHGVRAAAGEPRAHGQHGDARPVTVRARHGDRRRGSAQGLPVRLHGADGDAILVRRRCSMH